MSIGHGSTSRAPLTRVNRARKPMGHVTPVKLEARQDNYFSKFNWAVNRTMSNFGAFVQQEHLAVETHSKQGHHAHQVLATYGHKKMGMYGGVHYAHLCATSFRCKGPNKSENDPQ